MSDVIKPDGFLQFPDELIESYKKIWKWEESDDITKFPFIYYRVSSIERIYINIKHNEEIVEENGSKIVRTISVVKKNKKGKKKIK